jgi:hypothetical protein
MCARQSRQKEEPEMKQTTRKSRLQSLDAAFARLDRRAIIALIKESPYAWIFGEPAKPDAPNARRALSDACGKYKCHPPEYRFTPFGPPGRQQYVCVASVTIPMRPGSFTGVSSSEQTAGSKKAAAELAAENALTRLDSHFKAFPRNS